MIDITNMTDTELDALLGMEPIGPVEAACGVLRDVCPMYWPGDSAPIGAHIRALETWLRDTKGSDRPAAYKGYKIEIARARAAEMGERRAKAEAALAVVRAA